MRVMYIFLGAILIPLMGISQCPDPSCPDPVEGQLEAGVWGGDNWQLTVNRDGTIDIWTFCATGSSSEPVYAENGSVFFGADMVFEFGGPGRPGAAKFDGMACGDTFEFTYTTDDSYVEEGTVVYGMQGTVAPCPYD